MYFTVMYTVSASHIPYFISGLFKGVEGGGGHLFDRDGYSREGAD